MTPEQKGLLLKDLCARLPYGVICQCDKIKAEGTLREIGISYNMCRLYDSFTDEFENCYIFDCKPYLFPLSSIKKSQICNLINIIWPNAKYEIYMDLEEPEIDIELNHISTSYLISEVDCWGSKAIDWLNAHHFDYRGLIPMGLAEDATDKNIY